MKSIQQTSRTFLIACTALFLTACGGGGGGSSPGAMVGQDSVLAAVGNSVPVASCPNGGISVNAGIDTNSNGVLDPSEVMSTQYVCNGTQGANGLNTLVSMTAEPAGANCTNGGKKVSAGQDANNNGVLDAAEITSTGYVCNGAAGQNGTNGTNGTNGAAGLNSLVSIVPEPAGTFCTYGGNKVSSGVDANANGILDAAEVTTTTYVCNGAPGATGATGPAGPGVTWVNATASSVQAASNMGYMANSTSQVTITLPPAPAFGDVVQVTGVGTGGWKIAQNVGQSVVVKNLPGHGYDSWIPQSGSPVSNWISIASSNDGNNLIAAASSGQLLTSTDSGVTWTPRLAGGNWTSVASSSDGGKLAAAVGGYYQYQGPTAPPAYVPGVLYISSDSGATWATGPSGNWSAVASSTDGSKLLAADYGGQLYTSADSGATWTARDVARQWTSVGSSADGSVLVALSFCRVIGGSCSPGDQLYVSTDSGATWTARDSVRTWNSVSSSADGTKLVATTSGGQIYTSTDSGVTWTPRDAARGWKSVASSADGGKLVAVTNGGQIYTSADSGVTWTPRDASRAWYSVASSFDGNKLVAAVYGGQIYTASLATTVGITGSISGGQYDAIELQYVGNNIFSFLSYAGNLITQ